jgi:hypothetical protein
MRNPKGSIRVALILSHMAEQAAPSQEINLWPALQSRFENDPSFQARAANHRLKGTQMNTHLSPSSRLRPAALVAVAILVAFGLFFLTPQGKAFAQQILQFFTRQESDLLPVSDIIRTPTQPIQLVDQTTQTSPPIVTATPPGCDSIPAAHCTIPEIQPEVSFPVQQFGKLPGDVFLRGAVLEGQRVVLVYTCAADCFLLLTQEPAGEAAAQWEIGASAEVKTVQIQTGQGLVTGEYVQGTYTGPDVSWDPNFTTYTLRWEAAGIQYTIQWSPPLSGNATLAPDDTMLITLAESLTEQPKPVLNPNFLISAADASVLAGFPVRLPAFTPKGWDEPFYTYDAETGFVCLNYATNGMTDHPRLFVRQSATAPMTDLQPASPDTPASIQYEEIPIGGADSNTGRFTREPFQPPENACNGQNDFVVTNQVLQWTAQGITYEIYAASEPFSPRSVSRLDMLRMAEGITGVTTIPIDAPDPEHLWSIQEAETLAGFAVKVPAKLPEGYAFEMARMEHAAVVSMYRSTHPGLETLDLNAQPPVIYLYQCPAQSDGQDPCAQEILEIPVEAKEPAQVHQQPGFYAKGDMGADESTNWEMTWFANHMFLTQRLSWTEGQTSYLLKLMWGGGIDQTMMIEIAESLQ